MVNISRRKRSNVPLSDDIIMKIHLDALVVSGFFYFRVPFRVPGTPTI